VIQKVKLNADKLKHPVIGCLGLAFKADVDDLRESPSLDIVKRLMSENIGEVLVAEPNLATHEEIKLLPYDEVVRKADIVLLLVNHKEFSRLKTADLKEKILIDTRGVIK